MEEDEREASKSTGNATSDLTKEPCQLSKKAIVVLTPLSPSKISALRPPTPEQFYSEEDYSSSSGSDMTSGCDSSDSEFSVSNQDTREKIKKRVKITPASFSTRLNLSPGPVIRSFNQQLGQRDVKKNTKVRPKLPELEVSVDMTVIARKKPLRWERGKVVEIVTKEDGRVKYKVRFEHKGECLVSPHHIALLCRPVLGQLFVGARVVVCCQLNRFRFWPGIMAELPCQSNHFRFLVFLDDHTPVYVVLPSLHLVGKQLGDPLEDVPKSAHRLFMEQYLKKWPYPSKVACRVGQRFNAELKGVPRTCSVLAVDDSLTQVVFLESQYKEWIYRGSPRLGFPVIHREGRDVNQNLNHDRGL